jgi:hypothetical protein
MVLVKVISDIRLYLGCKPGSVTCDKSLGLVTSGSPPLWCNEDNRVPAPRAVKESKCMAIASFLSVSPKAAPGTRLWG